MFRLRDVLIYRLSTNIRFLMQYIYALFLAPNKTQNIVDKYMYDDRYTHNHCDWIRHICIIVLISGGTFFRITNLFVFSDQVAVRTRSFFCPDSLR